MNINGDGNPKLIGFSSNKEIAIELSSAIFDNRAIALLTGNKIVTNSTNVYRRNIKSITDNESNKTITLDDTPVGDLLGVYELGADGVEGAEFSKADETPTAKQYSISGKTLTFHSGVDEGTQIVVYYMVATDSNTQTITVSSDKFPAAFKLVMEVLVTDFHTKKLYPAQIVIPSCKMEDNWTLSFRPDGDPEPLNLPIEVLKPADSNDMFKLKIYSEEDLV